MDREEIRKRIDEEIEKTERSIADYKENTQPVAPENSIGRLSRMDAINNKSVVEAALREAEAKLEKLKQARKNVDNEDFGICKRCKNPIPIGRIMLMPQSPFCVNCAK